MVSIGRWGGSLLGWVLCGLLAVWPAPMAMAQGGESCYVALGDSVSSGYGLEEADQRFTQQVAEACGFTLLSLAQNGETSTSLLERLQDPEAIQAVAQADVITMTIGGNDLMYALYEYLAQQYHASHPQESPTVEQVQGALMEGDMTMLTFALEQVQGFCASQEEQRVLAQFSDNLTQVVEEIYRVNSQVCLVVANQYNPYSYLLREFAQYPPLAGAAQDVEEALECGVSALNGVIGAVGEQMGYSVADVYAAFQDAQENPCNATVSPFAKLNLDFHPNIYGHGLIAGAVTATTQTQLQVMGREIQAVVGEATTWTKPMDQSVGWLGAIPACGAGIFLVFVTIWRWKHCHQKRKK